MNTLDDLLTHLNTHMLGKDEEYRIALMTAWPYISDTFRGYQTMMVDRHRLVEENFKLKEALRWYDDVNEWIDYKSYGIMKDGTLVRVDSKFDGDQGKRAKEALVEEG